ECGEAALLGRRRRLRCVEAVKECAHRGQRRAVLGCRLAVADADAEHQPAAEVGPHGCRSGRCLGGLVGPDVEDAGCGNELGGRLEDRTNVRDARRSADPPRSEAEVFYELGGLARAFDAKRPVAGPDADLAEVDGRHVIASEVEMSRCASTCASRSRAFCSTAATASVPATQRTGGLSWSTICTSAAASLAGSPSCLPFIDSHQARFSALRAA